MTLTKIFVFLMVIGILVPATPLAAQDDRIQLVASHGILADVIRQVTGDLADVAALMPPGADPHSFEPTPGDLTSLANADLVFVNGARFEESLLEAIEGAAEGTNIVEASACVEIIPYTASDPHQDEHAHDDDHDDDHADDHDDEHSDHHSDDEHADDHDDEHGDHHSEDEHEDEHHEDAMSHPCADHDRELGVEQGHEHEALGRLAEIDCDAGHHDHHEAEHAEHAEHAEGACDPHVWMNPQNVMYWTLMIRDSLSAIDPAHADSYAAGAAAYLGELEALAEDFIEPALENLPPEKRVLVTSHDSLRYLAASYDFEIISTVIPGLSTLAEPSARQVAALIDLVKAEQVPAIFGETTVSQDIIQAIAAETDAKLVTLYSGSLSASDGPAATYLDYMRYNISAIIDALKGDS